MKKYYLIGIIFFLLIVPLNFTWAQVDTGVNKKVKVRLPAKVQKSNSYYFISLGHQTPAWYRVPMIPQYPVNMVLKGKEKVKIPGWFAGIGIMKKTRSNFEVGLLADFYKTTVPVAYSGQSSTSNWVYEQSGNTSYFTEVFENDVNRVSEVYSIRASIRYKIPLGNFQFWGGLAPGTFSSKIYFPGSKMSEPIGIYRETLLGITYQAGISLIFRNRRGNDILRFVFYSDFSGPEIDEKLISLFKPGWRYSSGGNFVINPVRLGFSMGIH